MWPSLVLHRRLDRVCHAADRVCAAMTDLAHFGQLNADYSARSVKPVQIDHSGMIETDLKKFLTERK
jgi:hypothetical protein